MNNDVYLNIKTYNAYALFIQHFYEHLLGCIARDEKSTKDLPSDKVDTILNQEAEILQRLGKFINNQIEVDRLIAKKLYDEFFEDKDPLDIIFTLSE